MIFNVYVFFGGARWGMGVNVVEVGVRVRVWGDSVVSQKGLTDRRAVGTGDRGHPGPSWANMGAFYGFIKLLTPCHPGHRKRSGT